MPVTLNFVYMLLYLHVVDTPTMDQETRYNTVQLDTVSIVRWLRDIAYLWDSGSWLYKLSATRLNKIDLDFRYQPPKYKCKYILIILPVSLQEQLAFHGDQPSKAQSTGQSM